MVDACAGLAESSAAALIGPGAEVLCFGVDTPPIHDDYRYLFSHLAGIAMRERETDSATNAPAMGNWRSCFRMVQAKVQPIKAARRIFRERAYEVFLEEVYEADNRSKFVHPAPEWTTEAALRVRDRLAKCVEKYDQQPGGKIDPETLCMPSAHGFALGFDRSLVVGRRGAGKSCLAHALCDPQARQKLEVLCTRTQLPNDIRYFLGYASPIGLPSPAKDAQYAATVEELDELADRDAHGAPGSCLARRAVPLSDAAARCIAQGFVTTRAKHRTSTFDAIWMRGECRPR